MKATKSIKAGLLENEDQFTDPFFKRFTLRHAPAPLQLTKSISKNYLFPTFYGDVKCAIGIFHCDFEKARAIMPHPKVKPVRMTFDRALVIFSCYVYRNVLGVAPYNEIAMTIPIMVDPLVNVPVLPMVAGNLFKEFGYYVFHMPVTSKENMLRGVKIWGLPKEVEDIDIDEEGGDCVTRATDGDGNDYFTLRVPMDGDAEEFDETGKLYTRLDDQFLQSETNFKGTFNVQKHMDLLVKVGKTPDREYLTLGDGPKADMLRALDIEPHPFQTRYCPSMVSCFDLADPSYKAPIHY